jgi:RNA polymerase sigma-70 factor (ECF subfamily)
MWDRDIRQRLTYGDEEALAEVYDLCAGTVYGVAMSVTREPEVAEQVALEVFTSLWNRPLAYDPAVASLRGWLAMSAHRRSVEWLRDNKPGREPAVSGTLTSRAVELAYFHGLTYHQIAAELGVAESTAKSRLRAGLRGL